MKRYWYVHVVSLNRSGFLIRATDGDFDLAQAMRDNSGCIITGWQELTEDQAGEAIEWIKGNEK